MKQLQDTDMMPFGKYGPKWERLAMQDVPANYLHYLWTSGKRDDKVCPVADYIRRNLSALQLENSDLIWE